MRIDDTAFYDMNYRTRIGLQVDKNKDMSLTIVMNWPLYAAKWKNIKTDYR